MLKNFLLFILLINNIFAFSCNYHLPLTKKQINIYINKNFLPRGHELYRINTNYIMDGPLNYKQIDKFFKYGYIIVENLIDNNIIERARTIKFETELKSTEFETLTFNSWEKYPILLEIANKIGTAVAQLTPLVSDNNDNLHIIKDAFFMFNGGVNGTNKGCDWHVDDLGFWPCNVESIGPGINAWLALDDIDENGGGLCIAPLSHTSDFINCRDAINNTVREIRKDKSIGTCNINKLFPRGKKKLDNMCYAPQMNAGDIILTTRFLFHRTSEFNNITKKKCVRRYTIRYMPSSAEMDGIESVENINKIQYYPKKQIKELYKTEYYYNKLPKVPLIKKKIKKYLY